MNKRTTMGRHRLPLILLGAVFFTIMAGVVRAPVWAAESIVITSLSVTFKDNYGEQEMLEPSITVKVDSGELSEVIWSRDADRWNPGSKVRCTLRLTSDGKIFSDKYNRSACKVSGAQFVSAKAEDNNTLEVKVDYLPVVTLGDTTRAGWSGADKTRANWEKVQYATGYQLNVYADDKKKATLTVSTNSADLSSYINDTDATWYYEVRAVGYSSEDKKYRKAGNYVTSDDTYFEPAEIGDVTGSWKNSRYQQEDGTYAVNTWKQIHSKWYYFDGSGNMVTGWLARDGRWYYLNSDGSMATGWRNLDSRWYYLEADGSMAVGWREINPGVWYYFNMDGSMAANAMIGPYWVDANGIWVQ